MIHQEREPFGDMRRDQGAGPISCLLPQDQPGRGVHPLARWGSRLKPRRLPSGTESEPSMSTNEDIRFLVGLARDKSVEGRKRLVAVVNDIFFADHSTLTDYERALITDILHRLISDLIEPVRQALAEQLGKDGADSPRLIDALRQDDIEMAAPVLRTNEPWLDVELVEVIRHRALEHQLMQSMRRTKGDLASDWGAGAGDSDFVKNLLDNDNKDSKVT